MLRDQLADERRRLDSRRQRAAGVVTSSVASAAFLFTMAGFALRDGQFALTDLQVAALLVAQAFLLGAACLGAIIAFRSAHTRVVATDVLTAWVHGSTAAPAPATELLAVLTALRRDNQGWESMGLNAALVIEGLALLSSAASFAMILLKI